MKLKIALRDYQKIEKTVDIDFPYYFKILDEEALSEETFEIDPRVQYGVITPTLFVPIDLYVSQKTQKIVGVESYLREIDDLSKFAYNFSWVFDEKSKSTYEEFEKAKQKAIKFLSGEKVEYYG